ncbi:hypothetical protein BaRGS_00004984 [Batillaria attramentaria]|uniref:Uncharacterized protein n=1 Tax=Batillaria attramentaria TaxID=370345 RepID=A0ABD0LWF8_9CAEN
MLTGRSSLCVLQLYENAMINAGLIDDARLGIERLHRLLDRALENKTAESSTSLSAQVAAAFRSALFKDDQTTVCQS